MNLVTPNGGSPHPFLLELPFHGFAVCLAVSNPIGPGFCFGSEDGRLLLTDEEGKALGHPFTGSMSGEAVNGIAGFGQWLAVTTRQDVTFWTLPEKEGGKVLRATIPHGAHDVIATACGTFAAPLGRAGIITAKPPFDEQHPFTVSSGELPGLNFYRIVSLRSGATRELFACAARTAGVGVTECRWDQESHNLSAFTFDDLDVVDVCAIGGADSLAVAAVARNGVLILLRDVIQEKQPVTLQFDTIMGTPYRLLSARGHLFLLTSKAMYVLARLAERFVAGDAVGSIITPMLAIQTEASDASICGDRWLLVVTPDGVSRYDVSDIHDHVPESVARGEIQESRPRTIPTMWRRQGIPQSHQLVGAAG